MVGVRTQTPSDEADVCVDTLADMEVRIAAGIRLVARHEDDRTLFPRHINDNLANGVSVAFGTGGVLLALRYAEGVVDDEILGWTLARNTDLSNATGGLFGGLAGVAWMYSDLGMANLADRLVQSSLSWGEKNWDDANRPKVYGLYHGLAGIGLTLLRLWMRQSASDHLAAAERLGCKIIRGAQEDRNGNWYWPDPDGVIRVGYAHGAAGIALFLLYLHLATGRPEYLTAGLRSIRHDVSLAATSSPHGALSFPPDTQRLGEVHPYLHTGAAGVGAVVLRYMVVAPEKRFSEIVKGTIRECTRKYTFLPGMFDGLSGLGSFLLDCGRYVDNEGAIDAAKYVASGILCRPVPIGNGGAVGFPGTVEGYLTYGFGSGSAGVLAFLHRLRCAIQGDVATPSFGHFMLDELLDRSRVQGDPQGSAAASDTVR